jgi:hypothetical protein
VQPPPRGRPPVEVDLSAEQPRPFDLAFDQRWGPWLKQAQPIGTRWLSKNMWEFKLDVNDSLTDDAISIEPYAVFRPIFGEMSADLLHQSRGPTDPLCPESALKAACIDVAEHCKGCLDSCPHECRHMRMLCDQAGKLFGAEAAAELLAFRLERLLGLFRAPLMVLRCFDLEADLGLNVSCALSIPELPPKRQWHEPVGHEMCAKPTADTRSKLERANAEMAKLQHHRVEHVQERAWAEPALAAGILLKQAAAHYDAGAPPTRVCGSLAIGIRGVTKTCPRLQTGFCESCGVDDSMPKPALLELADLALFDLLSENRDRRLSRGPWQEESGMFDQCPQCAAAETGVVVTNLHCISPSGAMLIVDQGEAFKGGGVTNSLPLLDLFPASSGVGSGKQTGDGLGLCPGKTTQAALMALGNATSFGRRFRGLMQELKDELIGEMFKPDGRSAAHQLCHFESGIADRVEAKFGHASRYVRHCEPDVAGWYAALRNYNRKKR